jgi:hypothetical protein
MTFPYQMNTRKRKRWSRCAVEEEQLLYYVLFPAMDIVSSSRDLPLRHHWLNVSVQLAAGVKTRHTRLDLVGFVFHFHIGQNSSFLFLLSTISQAKVRLNNILYINYVYFKF